LTRPKDDDFIVFLFRIQEEGRNIFAVILELNDVVETDAGLYKVNILTARLCNMYSTWTAGFCKVNI
jgi:hypothetical protein